MLPNFSVVFFFVTFYVPFFPSFFCWSRNEKNGRRCCHHGEMRNIRRRFVQIQPKIQQALQLPAASLSLSLSLLSRCRNEFFFKKKIIIIKTPSIAYRFDTDRGSKYRTGPTAWTLRDRPKSFFFLLKKPKKNENVNVQNPSWSQQQPTAEIPSNTRPMASLLPKFDYLAIHVFFLYIDWYVFFIGVARRCTSSGSRSFRWKPNENQAEPLRDV